MKIHIKHINNTFNYGSFMMAITLINKLKTEYKDCKIYIDAETNDDLARVIEETGVDSIFRDNIGAGNNLFQRCINKIKRIGINRDIKRVENIIIIGGDDISEYYGIPALERELLNLKKISENKNIILLGQTMGPFSENRGELARECLSNTKIYTRDDVCYKYLENLGFKNINIGRDLAFLPLPMQNKRKKVLDKYKLITNEYITIVPSGLVSCYTKNRENYISEQINILNIILESKNLKNKKIVLLPHVLLPKDVDDRIIIQEIVSNINDRYKERVIAIDDEMMPSEAREILGNGLFTITGRMHAAVSTLFMRKPAISLSYSIKYSGVIGDGLDLNNLVIECKDSKLWQEGKVSQMVEEKVEYVLNNYDDLVDKIDSNVRQTTNKTKEELKNLILDIKK